MNALPQRTFRAAALAGLVLVAVAAGEAQTARPLLFTAEGAPQRCDLWSVPASGEPASLGETEAQEFDPAASPDGTRIAYVSGTRDLRERHTDLWVMEVGTRARRQLTRSGQYVLAPSWSPDGKRVLFSTLNRPLAGAPEFGIRWVDVASGEQGSLGSGLWASLSPDGSRLLFTALDPKRNWEMTVHTAAGDGSGAKPLLGRKTMMAAWSPDGKRIAYAGPGLGDQPDLFIADADGSHRRQLTRTLEGEVGPYWSADGRLYFNRLGKERAATRIWSIDPSAKKAQPVQVTRMDRMEIAGPVSFWLLGPEPAALAAPSPG